MACATEALCAQSKTSSACQTRVGPTRAIDLSIDDVEHDQLRAAIFTVQIMLLDLQIENTREMRN